MNAIEQARLDPLYESMQRALKLQRKAKATTDAYSRAGRRTAKYFDRCPDDLTAEELRAHTSPICLRYRVFFVTYLASVERSSSAGAGAQRRRSAGASS